jgi:hypothetical protein
MVSFDADRIVDNALTGDNTRDARFPPVRHLWQNSVEGIGADASSVPDEGGDFMVKRHERNICSVPETSSHTRANSVNENGTGLLSDAGTEGEVLETF